MCEGHSPLDPVLLAIDLSSIPPNDRPNAIEAEAARLQASLDPVSGPITRAALFGRGPERPPLLLWAIHHLAVDGVSWRILLEDLDAACRYIRAGEPVSLPRKTLSFKRWAEILREEAGSAGTLAERPHWIAAGAPADPLPCDLPVETGPDDVASAARVEAVLPPAETRALLTEAHAAYSTQINDLLLAGLARALAGWTERREFRIDLESHGREPPDDRLDLSRTIGWFTSLHPLRLALPEAGWDRDAGADITAVKEALRAVPRNGIGYGLLRYLAKDAALASPPPAPIVFNYLGQFDGLAGPQRDDALILGETNAGAGPPRSLRQTRAYAIEVNALVLGGSLRLSIDYGRHRYRPETMQRLADAILAELRAVVRHCLSPGSGGYTPSDFAMAGLDDTELAKLAGLLDRVD